MSVVRARGTTHALCSLALLLAGCHASTNFSPGTPVLTLGDTSGNFAAYIITIDSMTLTNTDGTISTLFSGTSSAYVTGNLVDLAKLTDITELVSAPAVPAGTYTSAQLTLDYTAANIWINDNGHAFKCTAHDFSGNALGLVVLTITFDPAKPLVITASQSLRVALDADLEASNSVNTSVSPCVVSVRPFMTMRAAPVDSTPMRVRGLTVIAQPNDSNFIINTRPLFDLVSVGMGAVTVQTTAQTYYNINGVTFTGAAGLSAIGLLGLNNPVVAYGTLGNLSTVTPTFNATSVYAGTSLESPLEDHITGVVAARSATTLTVRGSEIVTRLGTVGFTDSSTVTLGNNTIVSKDGVAAGAPNLASISVGQQIDVSGQAAADTNNALTLDARAGQVRLASTRVWGDVLTVAPGSLALTARSLGNFGPGGFNFAGTGTSSASDTTYLDYEVNTGTLNTSAIEAQSLVAVDGFVAPFGSAPPDFSASAVTSAESATEKLVVEWSGGTTKPFSSVSTAGLTVDLSNTSLGAIHYIASGPVRTDLKSLTQSPLITTVGADQNDLTLAIGNPGLVKGISMYSTAAAFTTALNSTLNGTNRVYRLVAVGQYDNFTHTFVTPTINVALTDP